MNKIPHDHCHPDCAAFSNERNRGLTKREYFAAMALQGLLSCPHQMCNDIPNQSGLAVDYADALIAELNQEQPK